VNDLLLGGVAALLLKRFSEDWAKRRAIGKIKA
jgi:hypothetical protein